MSVAKVHNHSFCHHITKEPFCKKQSGIAKAGKVFALIIIFPLGIYHISSAIVRSVKRSAFRVALNEKSIVPQMIRNAIVKMSSFYLYTGPNSVQITKSMLKYQAAVNNFEEILEDCPNDRRKNSDLLFTATKIMEEAQEVSYLAISDSNSFKDSQKGYSTEKAKKRQNIFKKRVVKCDTAFTQIQVLLYGKTNHQEFLEVAGTEQTFPNKWSKLHKECSEKTLQNMQHLDFLRSKKKPRQGSQ